MSLFWRSRGCCLAEHVAYLAAYLPVLVLAQSVPPPVTDDAPAAGKRVRATATGWESTKVYHALYLPTDWTPGGTYPVIVEYAPNSWAPTPETTVDGSVEQTKLGFYQSGGAGFIWATMPFIDSDPPPARNTPNWWYGAHADGVEGADVAADYTKAGLLDILQNYGGDPASVLLTGFSRGAIAAGQIGLRSQLVDAWLAFLPHSHHYQLSTMNSPSAYPLLDAIAGRASFITAGENQTLDGGHGSSVAGREALTQLGFPVEFRSLPGVPHTHNWIQDDASATSLAVRQEMRAWIADTIANRPGTSSVLGRVTDSACKPLAGVRIQSGDTHWTFTDQNGNYRLAALVDGPRTLTASHPKWAIVDASRQITIAGADLADQSFRAVPGSTQWSKPRDKSRFGRRVLRTKRFERRASRRKSAP